MPKVKNQKYAMTIEKHCEYCGGAFYVNGYANKMKKRYCSRQCRGMAERKRTDIHCEYCGKEFYPFEKNARYCSLTCSSKAQVDDKFANYREIRKVIREENHKKKLIQKQQLIEARRLKREQEKQNKQEALVIKKCERCGCTFTGRGKYCSGLCARRAGSSNSEVRKRIQEPSLYKQNVSLEILYKRDNGICYICGKQCRYDDYIVRDGAFIAGDYYPSIDHVIPLSKNGEHSYTNTKLAHRICNRKKKDEIIGPLGAP